MRAQKVIEWILGTKESQKKESEKEATDRHNSTLKRHYTGKTILTGKRWPGEKS